MNLYNIKDKSEQVSFAQAVRDIARNAMPGKVLLIP